jgi:putative oxidoreductase
MKKIIVLLFITMSLISCVQKTNNHTVTILLDVSEIKDIKTVGIRGNENPFSWDYDSEMEVVKKDSLYKKTFKISTGSLCTEIKFTINGNFELKDKENRKVYFNKNGETIYKAKFNKVN